MECVVGEHVYIGTDIKARSFEQAKSFMQFLFKDKIEVDTEIFLIKEKIEANARDLNFLPNQAKLPI